MKKTIWITLASITLGYCSVARNPQPPGAPPVFSLDGKRLADNKAKLASKDGKLTTAYVALLKNADKALAVPPHSVMEKKGIPPSGDKHDYMSLAPYFWPDPSKPDGLPYIRKDGQTNPEVKEYLDKEYMPAMCEQVYTLGLAYYFSGDPRYAEHAAEVVRVWFLKPETRMNPNLNFAQAIKGVNDGRGAGLIDTRHFIKLIDGINLLKGSRAWTSADHKGMQDWCAAFLGWMQTSPIGLSELRAQNNHGTWYDAQRLALALYIDSTDLAKKISANVKQRLDQQMDAEGKFPREMERTIALHYNLFDLEAFYLVATMSEKLGIDLWTYRSPSGASLQKGFLFLQPYLTREKEWTGQQIKPFEFDEGYAVLLKSADKYGCTACPDKVRFLAGEKSERLREWLIY